MISRLQNADEPPSAELYRILLPLLSMHRQYTLVLNYLDVILEQGVALNTPEWSLIVGKALEQLPMVDAEQFMCTKVTTVKVDDNGVLMQLLQCLASVGAERKARRIVSLLGLEVGEFVTDGTLGDARLLPQEGASISSIVLKDEQVEKLAEVSLSNTSSFHCNADAKAVDDGFHLQVRSGDVLEEKVLCGPGIVG